MRKKKSPIDASLAEITSIGNKAFEEAAARAREAGFEFQYTDRQKELQELYDAIVKRSRNNP